MANIIGSYVPQLAKLAEYPPNGREWLIEPKFDGYRIGAKRNKGKVTLISRNGHDWTQHFSQLVPEIEKLLPANSIIDGEVMAEGTSTNSAFQNLQRFLDDEATNSRLHYYVFDILALANKNLRALPLSERQKILKGLFKKKFKSIHFVHPFQCSPSEALKEAKKQRYEGIIAKHIASPYQPGRGGSWLKIKEANHEEFAILGFSPHSKQPKKVGSLLLGLWLSRNTWVYCGKVGTGFNDKDRSDLWKSLNPALNPNLSIFNKELVPRKVKLVKPKLVGEVNFTEWTVDGMLRHPSFIGLREDKSAKEVSVENSSHPVAERL